MQVPREQYGLGSIFKKAKKAVKGITKGVKKFAKSDLGKVAGLAALGFGIPGTSIGGLFGRASLGGAATGLFGQQGIAATLGNLSMPSFLSSAVEGYKGLEGPGKFLAQAGIGTAISGGLMALMDEDEETREIVGQDVGSLRQYLASYYENLGYSADQIATNVARDTSEYGYADGGRIGYAMGTKENNGEQNAMAASLMEGLPLNKNSAGITEIDLRETGGFIPPVGVKEKADDIPALLSNNEFVYTADAVRAAGGGDIDKGAQIMYDTMKKLESKVV